MVFPATYKAGVLAICTTANRPPVVVGRPEPATTHENLHAIMARRNNRTAKKQKQPKKQQTQSKRMLVTRGRGLDPYGVAYARLLADPCNAALCSPIFGVGENGGYLLRVFSLVKLATGVGETEAALLWSPGLLNAANQNLVWHSDQRCRSNQLCGRVWSRGECHMQFN